MIRIELVEEGGFFSSRTGLGGNIAAWVDLCGT